MKLGNNGYNDFSIGKILIQRPRLRSPTNISWPWTRSVRTWVQNKVSSTVNSRPVSQGYGIFSSADILKRKQYDPNQVAFCNNITEINILD